MKDQGAFLLINGEHLRPEGGWWLYRAAVSESTAQGSIFVVPIALMKQPLLHDPAARQITFLGKPGLTNGFGGPVDP